MERLPGRPAEVIIDGDAFEHNLYIAESLAGTSQVVAVLKANAYGHGADYLARRVGQRPIAVASVDEAIALRRGGFHHEIILLGGPFDASCVQAASIHELTLVVHSFWQLDLVSALTPEHSAVSAWLKIDTGMHRLGFAMNEAGEAVQQAQSIKKLNLRGLLTHLACADEMESKHVIQQLDAFDRLLNQYHLQGSALNSGGLIHYTEYAYHQVRPGIMLYGASPSPQQLVSHLDLRPVMTFRSRVVATRALKAGESIGYGLIWTAQQDSTIATVAVGYADGYPREARNGTPVAIRGKRASLAGRVSMDFILVDVSDIQAVSVGDEVELWGEQISIDEVAECAGTIAYTLTCGIQTRVARTYK